MIKHRFFLFFLLFISTLSLNAQYSNSILGQWRDHLSYYSTSSVNKTDNKILVGSESSLFYYNPVTNECERFSKVNGLSDAGVILTAYDPETKTTIVTYENSNIDIVQEGKVYNISDIRIRSIEGSKEINSIYFNDAKAYLSCGFGIVVLDLVRNEIYDTYYVGENSSKIKVNAVSINDTSIFAATVNGLLYAPKNSNALAASQTWQKLPNIANRGVNNIEILNILSLGNGKLLINLPIENSTWSDTYTFDGENWETIFENEYIKSLRLSEGRLIKIAYRSLNIYDVNNLTNGGEIHHISDEWNPVPGINLDINDAITDGNDLWLAHETKGLIRIQNYRNGTHQKSEHFPDGPKSNHIYTITASEDGKIYIAPGGKTIQNAPHGLASDIYTFDGWWWQSLSEVDGQDTIKDLLNVSIDPNDPTHLMASSWWNGVIEIKDNKIVKVYNHENTDSVIQRHPYCYRIASVQYDASGNLLVANSLVEKGLCFLNYHNEWGGFETYSFVGENEILGMCLDRFYHYKFLWASNNMILVMNNNGDKILLNPNHGALDESTKVNCVVQDMDGEMWIGTDKGIKVAYGIENIFETNDGFHSNTECNNIIYQENGIAQYLLNFENVTCIMIDGGNRKWVGTERNGIYVLSATGGEQIYHFTAENSPLISNRIISMAQNELTGEVFIGTDRGVISYKAESVKGAEESGKLTAYPNPLRPHHSGTIAIKGFVSDSDVRITDISGNSVAHLKSIGGQAVWDGKNFNGEDVASGVYLIFSSAEEGNQTASGKVLIIR
jgi:hypothetical protein